MYLRQNSSRTRGLIKEGVSLATFLQHKSGAAIMVRHNNQAFCIRNAVTANHELEKW